MPTHIYQRPVADQGFWWLPLRVTGELPNYEYLTQYEGRLRIHNAIGMCTAKQVSGDRLPNGHSITVDPDTMEVVIAWPDIEYIDPTIKIYPATFDNPGFETGTAKGWTFGEGWSVNNKNNISGQYSACFNNFKGTSACVSKARHLVQADRKITATCTVRQGASAEGNVGARVTLHWFDNDGKEIAVSRGNLVDSASKNRTYPSRVEALPVEGAVYVSIGFEGVRYRENKELFLDDLKWDLEITEITEADNPEEKFHLRIEVTDSVGRVAYWEGDILDSSSFLSSIPYGYYMTEAFTVRSFDTVDFLQWVPPLDNFTTGFGGITEITLDVVVGYKDYTSAPDNFTTSMSELGLEIVEDVAQYTTYQFSDSFRTVGISNLGIETKVVSFNYSFRDSFTPTNISNISVVITNA